MFILGMSIGYSQVKIGQSGSEVPRISFGIYQDPMLAFTSDNYGNTPFTTDARFEFLMEGNYDGLGSLGIGITVQYADLSKYNLVRYGFMVGYNFRNIRLGNFYFDNGLYSEVGAIMRNFPEDNQTFISLALSNEFQVFITPWLSANLKTTLMQRGELGQRGLGSDTEVSSYKPWKWRFNNYLGLRFHLDSKR